MDNDQISRDIGQTELTPFDTPAAVVAGRYPCPKCEKVFDKEMALRMHNTRMHTPAGKQGYKWKTRSANTREQRLKERAIYQKKLRERYYAEGRNSKGKLMPPGWKPRKHGKDRKRLSYSTPTGKTREEYLAKQRQYQRNHYLKKHPETTTAPVQQLASDAASAILLAASVIRAVATGLKIGN